MLKKINLTLFAFVFATYAYSQNYLPLSGGTLTGNVNISGRYPYFSILPTIWNGNAFYIQSGVNLTGSSDGDYTSFQNPTAKGFAFAQQGAVKFQIGTDGNVGIGTTDTRGFKLAVAGGVLAESVKVALQGSWPDYVFQSDYQLPALSEIKAYIDVNHHLPEMPSESEVAKNGLNLGEMNKLLTKKAEELTLHLIEKEKQQMEQQKLILDADKKSRQQDERIAALERAVSGLLSKK